MVPVDAEEDRAGVIENGLKQVVSPVIVIVRSDIAQEDDHIIHGRMYFAYEVDNAVRIAVNVTSKIDHRSSSFRTYYTGGRLKNLGFPENVIGFGENVIPLEGHHTETIFKSPEKIRKIFLGHLIFINQR